MEGGVLLLKNVRIYRMWGLTNSDIKQHLDEILHHKHPLNKKVCHKLLLAWYNLKGKNN